MTTQTQRTPGPFALPLVYAGSETTTASWINDANGRRVCSMRACETDSDMARAIITACNAHDELVAALRGIIEHRDHLKLHDHPAITAARAALMLAERAK